MICTKKSRRYIARTLAAALICCMVLFLVQIVVHDHEKGQDEAACQVCHAAHLGSAPPLDAFRQGQALVDNGSVHEVELPFYKQLFANDSPSRAPPAA
jgi:hypothetical protein